MRRSTERGVNRRLRSKGTPMQFQKRCENTKHPEGRTILACPECRSNRAEIVNTSPLSAQCFDCDTTYPVQAMARRDAAGHKITEKTHKTKADYRAEITPAPPLSEEELGSNTLFMQEVIKATPDQIAKAEHIALKYSAKFGQEFEASWFLETEWLTKLKSVHRARAALRWRPKFLAALAIGRTMVFACKTASVAYNTAKYHRAQDRQFDEQCLAAMGLRRRASGSASISASVRGRCRADRLHGCGCWACP